jgi:chromosomal replication initiator protein
LTIRERDVVAALSQALIGRIGEPRYNLWFAHKTKFTRQDDTLVVGVANHFYQEWLHKTFVEAVRASAGEAYGEALEVRFAIDAELFQAARREEQTPQAPKAPVGLSSDNSEGSGYRLPDNEGKKTSDPPKPQDGRPRARAHTRRWRRLEEFVVGACNRVAHASAVSVVEDPVQGANPLVLHGSVGTGKTHLLEGIYLGLRKKQPEWRVCYVTAEDFTNRFVQSMRLGKLGSFRKHFRDCDTLLFDDLHFLATKRATQEEFLHTFDALQAESRQLVLTCDCHPRLSEQFLPELTDRLLGGAVWSLAPPDADTRVELLRSHALRSGLGVMPDDVLALLAQQLRGNVRELEGAIHSLCHYRRVTQRPVDLPMAREALGELLRHSIRVIQLPQVDQAVCGVLRLERGALQSKDRAWSQAHPRMLAMFLGRKHTSATYAEVGHYFGGRNHSTAVAAEKKVRHWLQKDENIPMGERPVRVRDLIERVERELLR